MFLIQTKFKLHFEIIAFFELLKRHDVSLSLVKRKGNIFTSDTQCQWFLWLKKREYSHSISNSVQKISLFCSLYKSTQSSTVSAVAHEVILNLLILKYSVFKIMGQPAINILRPRLPVPTLFTRRGCISYPMVHYWVGGVSPILWSTTGRGCISYPMVHYWAGVYLLSYGPLLGGGVSPILWSTGRWTLHF